MSDVHQVDVILCGHGLASKCIKFWCFLIRFENFTSYWYLTIHCPVCIKSNWLNVNSVSQVTKLYVKWKCGNSILWVSHKLFLKSYWGLFFPFLSILNLLFEAWGEKGVFAKSFEQSLEWECGSTQVWKWSHKQSYNGWSQMINYCFMLA